MLLYVNYALIKNGRKKRRKASGDIISIGPLESSSMKRGQTENPWSDTSSPQPELN